MLEALCLSPYPTSTISDMGWGRGRKLSFIPTRGRKLVLWNILVKLGSVSISRVWAEFQVCETLGSVTLEACFSFHVLTEW